MKKILGVTGCPTGIAHTFMAEEALKQAAKELGCEIKVETNGAIGVENALTEKDIQEADAIIVACDKNVDMNRFYGKPVIEVPVSDGINKAKDLIQRCLDGKVNIYHSGEAHKRGDTVNKAEAGNISFGHTIYKHLMNGVSHMLPLVVAGGVLVAISFLWGIFSADPSSEQYNVIAATLKSVGGYSMNLMVPVLAAFIAQSISGRPGMLAGLVGGAIAADTGSGFIGGILAGFLAGYIVNGFVKMLKGMPRQLEGLKSIFIVPILTVGIIGIIMVLLGGPCSALNQSMMDFLAGLQNTRPVVLGIVVGCMSAFDMGGPVNKAAYVTGTMLLGSGNYYFMAGVSAACITPPLVIALAATFCKNRFTPDDRTAGLVNYILGATHITEGAIPFAAKNPLKVIPVLMIASSVSAVLTYMLGITVPAPHGGFLILGLVNNPLAWVGCILVGSAIGAALYVLVTPKAAKEPEVRQKPVESEKDSLFNIDAVTLELKGNSKIEIINEMVSLLNDSGALTDSKAYLEEIWKREKQSTTGIGMGIAIPHAKTSAVRKPMVAVGISKNGFDYESLDGQPAHIIFMIAAGGNDGELHLKILSELSKKLMHQEFVDAILKCRSTEKLITLLKETE